MDSQLIEYLILFGYFVSIDYGILFVAGVDRVPKKNMCGFSITNLMFLMASVFDDLVLYLR